MAFDLDRYLPPAPLSANAGGAAVVAVVAVDQTPGDALPAGQVGQEPAHIGGLTLAALQDAAGEDWPEIADRPAALAALARLLPIQAQRDRGELPRSYTRPVLCLTCGPVWLWEGAPARLIACPWCLTAWGFRSIPRPLVHCGCCTHFRHSETSPESGLGLCGIASKKSKRTPGHWPKVAHACGAWRPIDPLGTLPIQEPS